MIFVSTVVPAGMFPLFPTFVNKKYKDTEAQHKGFFSFQLYSQENKHKEKIYKKHKSEERMCKTEILFQLKIWSVSTMEKEKKRQAAKSS